MQIRQLEAFKAVMTAGGVSRAAELLHISQPAISQLISQLESYCGFVLFQRSGRRLKPTREAEALLIEAEAMFEGIARVDRVMASLREQRWGALSIGAFPTICRRLLPRIVSDYCRERPDVKLHLQSMRSRSAIDAVATRQIDMALSFMVADRKEVQSEHLMSLKAVCVLPEGHPLASRANIHAADLANLPFVSLGPQDQSRLLIDKVFDDRGIPRQLHIETGQSDIACELVAQGMGVSIVDPISASHSQALGLVVRRFEPVVTFNMWLIFSKLTGKSSLVEHFTNHLVTEIKEAMHLLPLGLDQASSAR